MSHETPAKHGDYRAMRVIGAIILSLAMPPAGELVATAEHGGGFSKSAAWRVRVSGDWIRVQVFDGRPVRKFKLSEDQIAALASSVKRAGVFSSRRSYGRGDMEGHQCMMRITYAGKTASITLRAYSRREPPVSREAEEVARAFIMWDALKAAAGLQDLPDDCRTTTDIWRTPVGQ